jgi:hypothetical protein
MTKRKDGRTKHLRGSVLASLSNLSNRAPNLDLFVRLIDNVRDNGVSRGQL